MFSFNRPTQTHACHTSPIHLCCMTYTYVVWAYISPMPSALVRIHAAPHTCNTMYMHALFEDGECTYTLMFCVCRPIPSTSCTHVCTSAHTYAYGHTHVRYAELKSREIQPCVSGRRRSSAESSSASSLASLNSPCSPGGRGESVAENPRVECKAQLECLECLGDVFLTLYLGLRSPRHSP